MAFNFLLKKGYHFFNRYAILKIRCTIINKQLNKLSCSVRLIQIKTTVTAKRETGLNPVRTRHCKRGVIFLNHPFGVIATETNFGKAEKRC